MNSLAARLIFAVVVMACFAFLLAFVLTVKEQMYNPSTTGAVGIAGMSAAALLLVLLTLAGARGGRR